MVGQFKYIASLFQRSLFVIYSGSTVKARRIARNEQVAMFLIMFVVLSALLLMGVRSAVFVVNLPAALPVEEKMARPMDVVNPMRFRVNSFLLNEAHKNLQKEMLAHVGVVMPKVDKALELLLARPQQLPLQDLAHKNFVGKIVSAFAISMDAQLANEDLVLEGNGLSGPGKINHTPLPAVTSTTTTEGDIKLIILSHSL